MRARLIAALVVVAATLVYGAGAALADSIVTNTTPGYYNQGIGTVLDGTSSLFPLANGTSGDPTINPAPAPNLSPASGSLDGFLGTTVPTGASWSATPVAIPLTWAVNAETAIVYDVVTPAGTIGGYTNVHVSMGVDNGFFLWVNGVYVTGALAPGGAPAGEYSFALPNLPAGHNLIQILREDHGGLTGFDINITATPPPVNQAPTVSAGGPYAVDEGGQVTVSATGSDPEGQALTYAWDLDNDGTFETTGQTAQFDGLDGPATQTIAVRATDGGGLSTTATTTIDVHNVAPSITSLTGPSGPLALGAPATLNATWTDAGVLDTQTATWSWDDGTTSVTGASAGGAGTVTATHTYAAAGVYTVKLTLTDKDGGSDVRTLSEFIVVYSGSGFVTGGGWINSPAGAYLPNPAVTGRASFGFVSKYLPGRTTPDGQTEFQFQAGALNFHSTQYDWLVVSGWKAQYHGTGTINGVGGYSFTLTAYDGDQPGGGSIDRFRIKIWDALTNAVVYDNRNGASTDLDAADPQAIGGGSIVIHRS
jgi:hypothetical protein